MGYPSAIPTRMRAFLQTCRDASGERRPRASLVSLPPGGPGPRPSALRPAARSSLHSASANAAFKKHGPEALIKTPRWRAVRRAGTKPPPALDGVRFCFASHGAPLPLLRSGNSWEGKRFKPRAGYPPPREREGVFEFKGRATPHRCHRRACHRKSGLPDLRTNDAKLG